jgi:L-threonylcarbamoyladenylate synthase
MDRESISAHIEEAIRLVNSGGVIVYPTDTVYGIGCDPLKPIAIRRVMNLKHRSKSAMPILIDNIHSAEQLGVFNAKARILAEKFWPGPLTIVVPSKIHVVGVTDNGYVGLRIPMHDLAIEIIRGCNGRLLGTSANISGRTPATRLMEVPATILSNVDLTIDGGPTVGQPSTVVKVANGKITVERIGSISKSQLLQEANQTLDQ